MVQRSFLFSLVLILTFSEVDRAETPFGVGCIPQGDHYLIYWHYPGVNQVQVQKGDTAPDGYLFVSRDIPGARVGIEIDVPAGASAIESVE